MNQEPVGNGTAFPFKSICLDLSLNPQKQRMTQDVWTCVHGRQHDMSCCPYRSGHGFVHWRQSVPLNKDQSAVPTSPRSDGTIDYELIFPFEPLSAAIVFEMAKVLRLNISECLQLQRDLWYNYLRSYDVMKMAHVSKRLERFINPAILTCFETLIDHPPAPLASRLERPSLLSPSLPPPSSFIEPSYPEQSNREKLSTTRTPSFGASPLIESSVS